MLAWIARAAQYGSHGNNPEESVLPQVEQSALNLLCLAEERVRAPATLAAELESWGHAISSQLLLARDAFAEHQWQFELHDKSASTNPFTDDISIPINKQEPFAVLQVIYRNAKNFLAAEGRSWPVSLVDVCPNPLVQVQHELHLLDVVAQIVQLSSPFSKPSDWSFEPLGIRIEGDLLSEVQAVFAHPPTLSASLLPAAEPFRGGTFEYYQNLAHQQGLIPQDDGSLSLEDSNRDPGPQQRAPSKRSLQRPQAKVPCELCGLSVNPKSMASHRRARHTKQDQRKYPCARCNFVATSTKMRSRHVKSVHSDSAPGHSVAPYQAESGALESAAPGINAPSSEPQAQPTEQLASTEFQAVRQLVESHTEDIEPEVRVDPSKDRASSISWTKDARPPFWLPCGVDQCPVRYSPENLRDFTKHIVSVHPQVDVRETKLAWLHRVKSTLDGKLIGLMQGQMHTGGGTESQSATGATRKFVRCPMCPALIYRGLLSRHLTQHSGLVYTCPLCASVTNTTKDFTDHWRTKHDPYGALPWRDALKSNAQPSTSASASVSIPKYTANTSLLPFASRDGPPPDGPPLNRRSPKDATREASSFPDFTSVPNANVHDGAQAATTSSRSSAGNNLAQGRNVRTKMHSRTPLQVHTTSETAETGKVAEFGSVHRGDDQDRSIGDPDVLRDGAQGPDQVHALGSQASEDAASLSARETSSLLNAVHDQRDKASPPRFPPPHSLDSSRPYPAVDCRPLAQPETQPASIARSDRPASTIIPLDMRPADDSAIGLSAEPAIEPLYPPLEQSVRSCHDPGPRPTKETFSTTAGFSGHAGLARPESEIEAEATKALDPGATIQSQPLGKAKSAPVPGCGTPTFAADVESLDDIPIVFNTQLEHSKLSSGPAHHHDGRGATSSEVDPECEEHNSISQVVSPKDFGETQCRDDFRSPLPVPVSATQSEEACVAISAKVGHRDTVATGQVTENAPATRASPVSDGPSYHTPPCEHAGSNGEPHKEIDVDIFSRLHKDSTEEASEHEASQGLTVSRTSKVPAAPEATYPLPEPIVEDLEEQNPAEFTIPTIQDGPKSPEVMLPNRTTSRALSETAIPQCLTQVGGPEAEQNLSFPATRKRASVTTTTENASEIDPALPRVMQGAHEINQPQVSGQGYSKADADSCRVASRSGYGNTIADEKNQHGVAAARHKEKCAIIRRRSTDDANVHRVSSLTAEPGRFPIHLPNTNANAADWNDEEHPDRTLSSGVPVNLSDATAHLSRATSAQPETRRHLPEPRETSPALNITRPELSPEVNKEKAPSETLEIEQPPGSNEEVNAPVQMEESPSSEMMDDGKKEGTPQPQVSDSPSAQSAAEQQPACSHERSLPMAKGEEAAPKTMRTISPPEPVDHGPRQSPSKSQNSGQTLDTSRTGISPIKEQPLAKTNEDQGPALRPHQGEHMSLRPRRSLRLRPADSLFSVSDLTVQLPLPSAPTPEVGQQTEPREDRQLHSHEELVQPKESKGSERSQVAHQPPPGSSKPLASPRGRASALDDSIAQSTTDTPFDSNEEVHMNLRSSRKRSLRSRKAGSAVVNESPQPDSKSIMPPQTKTMELADAPLSQQRSLRSRKAKAATAQAASMASTVADESPAQPPKQSELSGQHDLQLPKTASLSARKTHQSKWRSLHPKDNHSVFQQAAPSTAPPSKEKTRQSLRAKRKQDAKPSHREPQGNKRRRFGRTAKGESRPTDEEAEEASDDARTYCYCGGGNKGRVRVEKLSPFISISSRTTFSLPSPYFSVVTSSSSFSYGTFEY